MFMAYVTVRLMTKIARNNGGNAALRAPIVTLPVKHYRIYSTLRIHTVIPRATTKKSLEQPHSGITRK